LPAPFEPTRPKTEHSLIEKEILEKKASIFEKLEIGSKVKGKVSRITDFGAFVDLGINGKEGLLHISKISKERVNKVEDVLKVGDEILVKVVEINKDEGKFSLSAKDAMKV